MNSQKQRPQRLRAALLSLLMLSSLTACAQNQTLSSQARMDRPIIPAPPSELTQTERLSPITTGDLQDYVTHHAEAAGAVNRLNTRINGWRDWAYCVTQAISTGSTPAACSK